MDDPRDRTDQHDELFEQFLRFEKLGMRKKAKESALALVAQVCGSHAEEAWTRDNLHRLRFNRASRIRHEIFQFIVFPSLKARMERGEPEASYLLGRYVQNLYADDALYRQIGYRSKTELFRDAYNSNLSSPHYRKAYLGSVLDDLGFGFHEWPSGILIEHSNWRQELNDLRAQISLATSLDWTGEYESLLAEWFQSIDQYEQRLSEKDACR